MKTIWFAGGKPDSRLIGWHHPPAASMPVLGAVLLCPPWGIELIRSYSALRRMAINLSRAGFHVLRFDYHATGDSSGASGEADPALWPEDILHAAQVLKQASGGLPISLVGLRLGALLATRAVGLNHANQITFDQVILWDPPINGRSYLRQMQSLNDDLLSQLQSQGVHIPPEARVRELVGLPISPHMVQAIEALELSQLCTNAAHKLQGHIQCFSSIPDVELSHLLAQMTQQPPAPTLTVIEDDGDWTNPARHAYALQTHALPTTIINKLIGDATPQPDSVNLSNVSFENVSIPDDQPQEEVLRFGQNQRLVGIVTLPPVKSALRDCPDVILLNPGLLYRIGAYRTSVALARSLARQGFRVLRLDVSGIGDSEARRERVSSAENPAIQDVTEAMDHLSHCYGSNQFVLQGLCNGAGLAHDVAVRDTRVVGLLAIDTYAYRTPASIARIVMQRCLQPRYLAAQAFDYLKKALSPQFWAQRRAKRDLVEEAALGEFFAFPEKQLLEQEMAKLAERGMNALFIYTKGAEAIFNHVSQFTQMFPALKSFSNIEVLLNRDSDHTTMLSASRRKLINQISSWMGRHFGHSHFVPLALPKNQNLRASDLKSEPVAEMASNKVADFLQEPRLNETGKFQPSFFNSTPNG